MTARLRPGLAMSLVAAGCAGWAGSGSSVAAPWSPLIDPSPSISALRAEPPSTNGDADPDVDTDAKSDADSLKHLAAEVEAHPDSRAARWNYGFMLFRHGHIAEADRQFVLADELGPDAYSALMRGVIAEQQLRYADAKRHYQDATSLPGNAQSARQARENLGLLNSHLTELQRFLQVDRRLDRDLWLALLAFGGFAGILLWTTRSRGAATRL